MRVARCDQVGVDVAPPWTTMTGKTCSGETRRCGGGDAACYAEAERDGYVAISNYSFCKRDEVNTIPTASGFLVLLATAAAVVAAAVMLVRRRARR